MNNYNSYNNDTWINGHLNLSPDDWNSAITATSTLKDFDDQCGWTISYPADLGQGHFNKALKEAKDCGNIAVTDYITNLDQTQYINNFKKQFFWPGY
jgi:hypothetical protein